MWDFSLLVYLSLVVFGRYSPIAVVVIVLLLDDDREKKKRKEINQLLEESFSSKQIVPRLKFLILYLEAWYDCIVLYA